MEDYIRRHRRGEEEERSGRYDGLRQILNLIFMIGAIAGMCVYFFYEQNIGTIVILTSMIFKIVECVLRMMR